MQYQAASLFHPERIPNASRTNLLKMLAYQNTPNWWRKIRRMQSGQTNRTMKK